MNNRSFFSFLLIFLFGFNFSFICFPVSPEQIINDDKQGVIRDEKSLPLLEVKRGDNKFRFTIKNRSEVFYARSTQLFSPSELDQILYWQSTWDLKTSLSLGNCLRSDIVLRNKARWGNINSINHVTENEIKLKDAVTGKHKHSLGKLLFWMREGWVEFLLNDTFNLHLCNNHYFKVGAFPFKLGRGIALGEAYAVSPGLLGFYSNNVIDQYAFGSVLHGTLIKEKLNYDLYGAILENQSDSFDNVNEKIYSQEIGKRDFPYRGFGSINFLIAARLDWFLYPCRPYSEGILTFEPYILYNRNPEQKVDFPSDASSHLATLGMYVDFEGEDWEWGFEFAKNFGHQKVRAWDRNKVILDRDSAGNAVFVYSHVVTQNPETTINPKKAHESNANKKIVDASVQDPALNGKQIDSTGLYNDITRFRKEFINKYTGFMFVGDIGYWFNDNLRLAATVGWATGDEDPNQDLDFPNDSDEDGNFEAFIGLQEIYSGKRVQSVFVIGPNRIPRPLSFPRINIPIQDRFASNVTGFSNIIYFGTGLDWSTCGCTKEFNFRPNVLAYWMDHATNKFSMELKQSIPNSKASRFLGTEVNLFVDVKLLKNLKGFFVGGVFIPGQHYKDIKGKPLNSEQREILDRLDSTGFEGDIPPLLGTNPAWSLNWGFEYTF